MATKKETLSIQSYKPAKGTKLTVTLKDGTEIVGTVTTQNANSIKLDDEAVLRRKIRTISFRGKVLAERGTRGGKKSKLSARTASGSPRKGRRGKAVTEAQEKSGMAFMIDGDDHLMVTKTTGEIAESIRVPLTSEVSVKLGEFGVPTS